jgi:hypothetical protein
LLDGGAIAQICEGHPWHRQITTRDRDDRLIIDSYLQDDDYLYRIARAMRC